MVLSRLLSVEVAVKVVFVDVCFGIVDVVIVEEIIVVLRIFVFLVDELSGKGESETVSASVSTTL